MALDALQNPAGADRLTAICRIPEAGVNWRVLVEIWPEAGGYRGRLLFAAEGAKAFLGRRDGPPTLRGRRREDVIAAAHDLPERRLRELLHSLS